jgi:hypothetical protein
MSLDWETLISAWLEAEQHEDDARWTKAAIAKVVLDHYGIESARAFAAEVGASARQVLKSRQAFEAFPNNEIREAALSFEHHFLASCGAAPVEWIAAAAERRLSLRQLRDAIVRAEAERQTPPPGSYRFGKSDEFEAHDIGVALVGEQVERHILSLRQWQELMRLLAHYAATQRWIEAPALPELLQSFTVATRFEARSKSSPEGESP